MGQGDLEGRGDLQGRGDLKGKVALISGGARGMGAAEARLFVREGARVVIGDVLEEAGHGIAADLGEACRFVPLDVTSESDWQAAVAHAEATFGRLDVLVNNAGILRVGLLEETTLEEYEQVVKVNQTGVFLGMRSVVAAMRRAGAGSIVNISSMAGMKGVGGAIAYTASKFAVRGMTKAAAVELGAEGIRVNSVHPGGVDTPMTVPEGGELPTVDYPIARIARPEEVAELVLWLASDRSSYSTGAEFMVDGGDCAGHMPERFRLEIEARRAGAGAGD